MKKLQLLAWLIVPAMLGCQQLNLRSQNPENEQSASDNEFETTVETPLVGDYTNIVGLHMIALEGVGLVVGLDGTGGDPPPSMFRTALVEDLKRRGIKDINTLLRSPNTALVAVRAYLPPMVKKGDKFDVEVRLPGNSEATSLDGGILWESYLSEQAIIPGRGVKKGFALAKAKGPVLISTGEGSEASLAGVVRRGRIVGGGVSLTERDLSIYLSSDFRSFRNSRRMASRIGQRFSSYDRYGIKEPLAEAKTDQKIELKVDPKYRDNFPRYLQVVRSVAFRETPVARNVRMQKLKEQLHDPIQSEKAALQLEAIGIDTIPILKSGLKNPDLEVQFHSAVALAYLGEPDGLPALARAAREERAFRVFALAAMATVDEAESHMLLRELMNPFVNAQGEETTSAELRVGAFRALATLDRNDPFIRGRDMNGQFSLHVLQTHGQPMIHLTSHKQSEVVLFGANQKFRTPIAVRAGQHIRVNATPGSDTVTISRYVVGEPDRRETVPARVADVIRAVVDMDATYPDVAQMLIQASKQDNLASRIEIDALPRAGRVYYRSNGQGSPKRARAGNSNQVPNLFPLIETPENQDEPEEEDKSDLDQGVASLSDARSQMQAADADNQHRWFSSLNPLN